MPVVPSGRRAALIAVGALAAGSLYLADGAAAGTTTTTTFTSECFAQLVALKLGGTNVPLDAGRSCATPGDSFFPTDRIAGPAEFPFVVNVLYESTSRSADQSSARARAGVAHVFLPFSKFGGKDVTLDVLTSESSCNNGSAAGSSHVVALDVGGQVVELPPATAPNPIVLGPLGTIEYNKTSASTSHTDSGAGTNPRVVNDTAGREQTALHVVLLPGTPLTVDLTVARTSVSCSKTTTTTTTPPPPPRPVVGWMSGGGQLPGGITHSLVLPCTTTQTGPGPKLHVETPNGMFDLTDLSTSECSQVGSAGPGNPAAGFNTLEGEGLGTCNGHRGVDATFTFTDGGEPNQGADKATVSIDKDNKYGCKVSVVGATVNGNQQAHRGKNPPS